MISTQVARERRRVKQYNKCTKDSCDFVECLRRPISVAIWVLSLSESLRSLIHFGYISTASNIGREIAMKELVVAGTSNVEFSRILPPNKEHMEKHSLRQSNDMIKIAKR